MIKQPQDYSLSRSDHLVLECCRFFQPSQCLLCGFCSSSTGIAQAQTGGWLTGNRYFRAVVVWQSKRLS